MGIYTGKHEEYCLPGHVPADDPGAAQRVQWHARGHGRDTQVVAFCPICKLEMEFRNVSLNAQLRHCGKLDRMPSKTYEQYCLLRDNNGRPRIPEQNHKVRWF